MRALDQSGKALSELGTYLPTVYGPSHTVTWLARKTSLAGEIVVLLNFHLKVETLTLGSSIVMEVTSKDDTRVPPEVFMASSGLNDIMPRVFAPLTRLELCIDMQYEHDVYSHPWRSDGFTLALSSARNLKTLHISLAIEECEIVDRSGPAETDFSALFARCSFPKLEILCIDRCTINEEEIPKFLRKSPNLQSLVFRRCTLYGLWRPLVQRIRDDLTVKSLQLDWIRGQFDEDEKIGDLNVEKIDLAAEVLMDFFLRERGSAFSWGQLADGK